MRAKRPRKLFRCTHCGKLHVCPQYRVLPVNPGTGESGRCDNCGHDQFELVLGMAGPEQTMMFER